MDNELETTEDYSTAQFTKDIAKAVAIAAAPYVTYVGVRYVYRKVQERKALKNTQTEEN